MGEGNVLSLFTGERGYLLQGTYPSRSRWGGYPKVPTPPVKVLTPPPPVQVRTGGRGYPKVLTPPPPAKVPPQVQVRTGEGVPTYEKDFAFSLVPQLVFFISARTYPSPQPRYLPPRDRTAFGVLDTLWSVSLLRSRRRTFLF